MTTCVLVHGAFVDGWYDLPGIGPDPSALGDLSADAAAPLTRLA